MPMNPRLLRPTQGGFSSPDADARAYLAAVRQADGANLEPAVAKAISDFVIGCKADGIWDAIKASCILMGARTLSGALTPLKGGAPTNVSNNFVSGDYDRETGLVGGAGKYIDSNRNRQDDPQDSSHIAIYISSPNPSGGGFQRLFGCGDGTGRSRILRNANDTEGALSHGRNVQTIVNTGGLNGFTGLNRSSSASYGYRINGNAATVSDVSEARPNANWHVFNNNPVSTVPFLGRIAFYSIGESLSLSDLDSRISTLYAAIGAAI
jgi:hypothetical protein